jgi:hypothetical protein
VKVMYELTLLTMLLYLSETTGTGKPVEIPRIIVASGASDLPGWVIETVAVDASGALSETVLREHDRQRLASAVNRRRRTETTSTEPAASDTQCETYIGRALHQPGTKGSIGELAHYAHTIFSGRIEAGAQGFFYGQPGTLFAIEITEAAKGKVRAGDVVYLFYPSARITTAGGVICAKPIGDATVPRVGDFVVAFPFLPPDRTDVQVFSLEPSEQLIVFRDGNAFVPAKLTRELSRSSTTPASVLQRVRESPAPLPEMQQ